MEHQKSSVLFSATDLTNHLVCSHLTQLNRRHFEGEIPKPSWRDPVALVLQQRGIEHENRYVDYLRAQGLRVIDLKENPDPKYRPTLRDTLQAMNEGYDVIVQARLENSQWGGFADILIKRVDTHEPSNYYYEVQDTKLSQDTRAGSILQLCLYTELLCEIQVRQPEFMSIIKPGDSPDDQTFSFKEDKYRYDDFKAYFQVVKRRLAASFSIKEDTYPNPVEHCTICNWWQECGKKRKEDDHLSLVAGIRSSQIKELNIQHIETLEQFATAPSVEKPTRGNYKTLLKKKDQAEIQLTGRKRDELIYELLPIEEQTGLYRLPKPSAGDVYFDIEGDAFYEGGSLEYLFGYVYKDEKGKWVYQKIWAKNRSEEKIAFQQFIDFVRKRWENYPEMCIYHYAPYEPSALKRLTRVHGIEEPFVAKLLRGLRFVDLHKVLKEALLASVEQYSLKNLEKFAGYERVQELREAGSARRAVERALELGEAKDIAPDHIRQVEDYNEDDCRATFALHQWIEQIRQQQQVPPFQIKDGELQSEEERNRNIEFQQSFNALTEWLPENRDDWNKDQQGLWLLANILEYFRRERDSKLWEFFSLIDLEEDELLDERKAIAYLSNPVKQAKKSNRENDSYKYSFATQEIEIKEGSELFDHETRKKIGTLVSIDNDQCTVIIKEARGIEYHHPVSVVSKEKQTPDKVITDSLVKIAKSIINNDLRLPENAICDLLLKNSPRLKDQSQEFNFDRSVDHIPQAIHAAINLDSSILAIQGPPGTGKTHTGAEIILSLMEKGKKIGVTALSHKAIIKLLTKVQELATEKELGVIKLMHKGKTEERDDIENDGIEFLEDADGLDNALQEGYVVGGTAWLWASDTAENKLDYLIVDEAGQLALSYALAVSRSAKNLILLGDPIQLEQPQQGTHPEGSGVAALEHMLDGHQTIPADKGIFIGISRRLHPQICAFTSELFYENKLQAMEGLEKQLITGDTDFSPSGLFYVPVQHEYNRNCADEEIDIVEKIISELLSKGQWESRPLKNNDILIMAPYNAQVNALKERLPGLKIGTVDKFQGQEAPIVIYSMTSSSAEDAPRGMSFLYDPNRFNVATSRALSVCILVGSPKLFKPECKAVEQMKWANVFCRYKELARQISYIV